MGNLTGILMSEGVGEGVARTAKVIEIEGVPEPCIIIGAMPTLQTALRMRANIRGVVTDEHPGELSHIIILLRELQIPVLCVETLEGISENDYLRIEGESVKKITGQQVMPMNSVIFHAPKYAMLQDGHSIELYATVWDNDGAGEAMEAGFSGIGLFRTEGLACTSLPSVTDQLQIYARTIELVGDRSVTFRLFDFSGDKSEASPRDFEQIYHDQLMALLCAAPGKIVRVLVPNVNYRMQISEIKRLSIRLQAELVGRGVPCGKLSVGAMIETPMAAAISEDICSVADFVSVGLNGMNRLAGDFPIFHDRYNEAALLRICKLILDNASAAGKEVCMCGDLLCEAKLLRNLIGLGVKKLSVSTQNAGALAVALCKENYREAQKSSLEAMKGFLSSVRMIS